MTNPNEDYPLLFAQDVANAFIEWSNTTCRDEEEHIHQTALMIGGHLASAGHQGDWSQVSIPTLFQEMRFVMSDHQMAGVCITIVGLFGWLGGTELVAVSACRGVLQDMLATLPPSKDAEGVFSLAQSGLSIFDTLDCFAEGETDDNCLCMN